MYHLCFHIIFTFPATVPLLFHPFLGHFNRNLLAKSPHVPPLFPNFFSHPVSRVPQDDRDLLPISGHNGPSDLLLPRSASRPKSRPCRNRPSLVN
jgi:hypothetical protein